MGSPEGRGTPGHEPKGVPKPQENVQVQEHGNVGTYKSGGAPLA